MLRTGIQGKQKLGLLADSEGTGHNRARGEYSGLKKYVFKFFETPPFWKVEPNFPYPVSVGGTWGTGF